MSRLISLSSGRFRCPGFSVAPRSRVRTIPGFRSGGRPPAHARRRKTSEKPAKVVTDETLEVKKGDVQSAAAEQLRMPGTPEAPAQPAPANAPSSAPRTKRRLPKMKNLPRNSPR